MQIVKCISTIEEFSPVEFQNFNIGVEIQDFVEPNLKDNEIENLVYKYEKLLKNFPYTKSLHGPFLDLKPVSPDKDIRRISYKKYIRTLEIAKQLNVDYVIFHSQINPWLNEPYIKSLNNNQNKDFWHYILDDIKDFKGQILLENIFENNPLILKELVETIDLSNIKVCLDIGHAKLRTNTPLEKWIKELGEYVEYVHLHWNEGLYDEHLKPDDENIRYIKELLVTYDINPIIALEYKINDLEYEIQRINRL